eukprot:365486-Chlamydomonas_euryale.AAC.11
MSANRSACAYDASTTACALPRPSASLEESGLEACAHVRACSLVSLAPNSFSDSVLGKGGTRKSSGCRRRSKRCAADNASHAVHGAGTACE